MRWSSRRVGAAEWRWPKLSRQCVARSTAQTLRDRAAKGQTYRGSVRLPLPICEWYAYEIPISASTIPVQVTELRYRLEVLRESACRKPIREFDNFKGVYPVMGYLSETYEAKAQLARPITVLKRTDKFERFG